MLRKQHEPPPESFDEPTALIRRDERTAFPAEVTIRTKPAASAALPRGTVGGRLDRGAEAPPLPFAAKADSAPPPPAVDLYEGASLDPLNVTGKLKRIGGAALPFNGRAAAPPTAPAMGETATTLPKVHEDVLPFDAPRPKYPPRQLVPLEHNPLYAGGASSLATMGQAASSDSRKRVAVTLLVVALVVAALLFATSTGT